jgi:hypothetical protein
MSKRWFTLFAGIAFAAAQLAAQDIPTDVAAAFRAGKAEGIAVYMDNKSELSVVGDARTVGSEAVVAALNKFLTTGNINGFNVVHQGIRDKSGFIIGTLTTSAGNYRVNCYFNRTDDKYIIHQIRIEKING